MYTHRVNLFNCNIYSIFPAEIEVIFQTTQLIITYAKEYNVKHSKILSDSQAAITALSNMTTTSKCVLQALESMETAASLVNNLTLAWVKADFSLILFPVLVK